VPEAATAAAAAVAAAEVAVLQIVTRMAARAAAVAVAAVGVQAPPEAQRAVRPSQRSSMCRRLRFRMCSFCLPMAVMAVAAATGSWVALAEYPGVVTSSTVTMRRTATAEVVNRTTARMAPAAALAARVAAADTAAVAPADPPYARSSGVHLSM